MKISYTNAHERIADKLAKFQCIQHKDGMYDEEIVYYEMSEEDFDKVISEILEESTKDFKQALLRYTKKYKIAWLGKADGARISTYNYDYAFVKFTK